MLWCDVFFYTILPKKVEYRLRLSYYDSAMNERGPAKWTTQNVEAAKRPLFCFGGFMGILANDIRKTSPLMCRVDKDYLNYLRRFDHRISTKFPLRPSVCLAIIINGKRYAIPLTSQTTQKRLERGKKKRSHTLTTFIKSGDVEIANLLHNNMFPVPDYLIKAIEIDSESTSYIANEERYIRKHWVEINEKSMYLYRDRYNKESANYTFFDKMCCDFKLLEKACEEYE